jgi:hypothetical protein
MKELVELTTLFLPISLIVEIMAELPLSWQEGKEMFSERRGASSLTLAPPSKLPHAFLCFSTPYCIETPKNEAMFLGASS